MGVGEPYKGREEKGLVALKLEEKIADREERRDEEGMEEREGTLV